MEFTTSIYRYNAATDTETETDVTVEFNITPEGGDGWNEPRYPAEAEIESVTDSEGNAFETTKEEEEDLITKAFEAANAEYEYGMELQAEARAEARMERALYRLERV